jgi:hypothetical protein
VRVVGLELGLVIASAVREGLTSVLATAGASTVGPQVATAKHEPSPVGIGQVDSPEAAPHDRSSGCCTDASTASCAGTVRSADVLAIAIPACSAAISSTPVPTVTQALMLVASVSWRSSRPVMIEVRRWRILMRTRAV